MVGLWSNVRLNCHFACELCCILHDESDRDYLFWRIELTPTVKTMPHRLHCLFDTTTHTSHLTSIPMCTGAERVCLCFVSAVLKSHGCGDQVQVAEGKWRPLVVEVGALGSVTGVSKIAASVIAPLADHNVSVFCASTNQEDYVLVSVVWCSIRLVLSENVLASCRC